MTEQLLFEGNKAYLWIDLVIQWKNRLYYFGLVRKNQCLCEDLKQSGVLFFFCNLKILILESQYNFSWRRPLDITWSKALLIVRPTSTLDQVVQCQIQLSFELCPPRVEVQQYLQATSFVSLCIGEQHIIQVSHKNLIASSDVQFPNLHV